MKKKGIGLIAVILVFVAMFTNTQHIIAAKQEYTVDYTEYNKVEVAAKARLDEASENVQLAEAYFDKVVAHAMHQTEQKNN